MSRVLHFQADRIEMVLASLGGRRPGHQAPALTPGLVRFQVATALGIRVDNRSPA